MMTVHVVYYLTSWLVVQACWLGPVVIFCTSIYQVNSEPSEFLQWLCHDFDDSNINIVHGLIITGSIHYCY